MKSQALVIEDNQIDQVLTQTILETLGFEVTVSNDGEEAIKYIMDKKFDLIVLDLEMPNINGRQFLSGFRISGLNRDCPAIVVSGKDDEASRKSSKFYGAAAYIQKPLNLDRHKNLLVKYLLNPYKGVEYG